MTSPQRGEVGSQSDPGEGAASAASPLSPQSPNGSTPSPGAVRRPLPAGARLFGAIATAVAFLAAGCARGPHELDVTGITSHPISGSEIVALVADHTAVMPDGSFEYYAPNGRLLGSSGGQGYQGTWQVKDNLFCTLLDNDITVCSEVSRDEKGVYWSPDGEKKVSRIAELLPGNAKDLK